MDISIDSKPSPLQKSPVAMPASSSSNDVQLTAMEASKFDAAFKSEEFSRLISDYVESLSDPSNREEQEAYISELEANKELPPGKSLIRPNAGFVVKYHIVRGNEDKPLKKKIFLNIVYSDKITEPSSSFDESSLQAKKWSVPYAIGPVRMEHDKSNNLVPTFDICFHPLSLQYAHARKEFFDMVIGISQSAVVQAYSSSSNELITIASNNYAILKNVRYKNGTPKALIIGSYHDQSFHDHPVQPADNAPDVTEDEEAVDAITTHTEEADLTDSTIIPNYKIVEQGIMELTSHNDASIRRPKQLIVHVYLDKIVQAEEIDLNVSKDKVQVLSEEHKYKLNLRLPYPIDSQKGKATFDKAKRSLILRLPLITHVIKS